MARRRARASAPHEAHGPELLWAPWRSVYVSKQDAADPGCIFCCGPLTAAQRRRRLVLHLGPRALVMLNRYPYNNGHLMVAPRTHAASPELLAPEERTAVAEYVTRSVTRLRAALRPAGINVGVNLGRAAGAGIADHMHWHLVPRWEGDNNFMPVIGATRVLPQSLGQTYALLAPMFKTIETALS